MRTGLQRGQADMAHHGGLRDAEKLEVRGVVSHCEPCMAPIRRWHGGTYRRPLADCRLPTPSFCRSDEMWARTRLGFSCRRRAISRVDCPSAARRARPTPGSSTAEPSPRSGGRDPRRDAAQFHREQAVGVRGFWPNLRAPAGFTVDPAARLGPHVVRR
jgi:hypothetical protein